MAMDRPHDRPPGLLLHHLLRMLSNVEFSELLEEVEVPGFLSHSPSIATRLEAIVSRGIWLFGSLCQAV